MKAKIGQDEIYIYYEVSTDARYGREIEVPDETLARWRATQDAFDAMQDEMRDLFIQH